MSQSTPERQVLSRRRARRAPLTAPAVAAAPESTATPWGSLLGLAVIVALVVGAGYALGRAIVVEPSGPFANCHTAKALGPHTFVGPPAMCIDKTKTYIAKVSTSGGAIDIAMPAAEAPQTVNNFVVLAVNGFYAGLTFHRDGGWVIQGGDPLGDGRGGPGYSLPPEPNAGTWGPDAVGMARNPDGTINGSQFIVLKRNWPGNGPGTTVFNHFGTVLGGTQIVTALKPGDRILSVSISIQ